MCADNGLSDGLSFGSSSTTASLYKSFVSSHFKNPIPVHLRERRWRAGESERDLCGKSVLKAGVDVRRVILKEKKRHRFVRGEKKMGHTRRKAKSWQVILCRDGHMVESQCV